MFGIYGTRPRTQEKFYGNGAICKEGHPRAQNKWGRREGMRIPSNSGDNRTPDVEEADAVAVVGPPDEDCAWPIGLYRACSLLNWVVMSHQHISELKVDDCFCVRLAVVALRLRHSKSRLITFCILAT
jgi:hypothetical protein